MRCIAPILLLAMGCGTTQQAECPDLQDHAAADTGSGAEAAHQSKIMKTEGSWSEAVSGLRGRLIVSTGEEYQARVEVELQNVSDRGNPMEISWDVDKVLTFELEDSAGKAIPVASPPTSILTPEPYSLFLPHDSTLRVNVTTYGFGYRRDQRLFIGLPGRGGPWHIASSDKRQLFLKGTLSSYPSRRDEYHRPWKGSLVFPRVEVR